MKKIQIFSEKKNPQCVIVIPLLPWAFAVFYSHLEKQQLLPSPAVWWSERKHKSAWLMVKSGLSGYIACLSVGREDFMKNAGNVVGFRTGQLGSFQWHRAQNASWNLYEIKCWPAVCIGHLIKTDKRIDYSRGFKKWLEFRNYDKMHTALRQETEYRAAFVVMIQWWTVCCPRRLNATAGEYSSR